MPSPATPRLMRCSFSMATEAMGNPSFLDTLSQIMADYAKVAPIETFTASTGDRHPTDVAGSAVPAW